MGGYGQDSVFTLLRTREKGFWCPQCSYCTIFSRTFLIGGKCLSLASQIAGGEIEDGEFSPYLPCSDQPWRVERGVLGMVHPQQTANYPHRRIDVYYACGIQYSHIVHSTAPAAAQSGQGRIKPSWEPSLKCLVCSADVRYNKKNI